MFKVSEINNTNHLVKEEDKEDDVPQVPHDRAMKSYPMRRPDVPVNKIRNLMFESDTGEEREPIIRSGVYCPDDPLFYT